MSWGKYLGLRERIECEGGENYTMLNPLLRLCGGEIRDGQISEACCKRGEINMRKRSSVEWGDTHETNC
jgi:hypothetical protein